jgi:hypothetical protein
VESSATPESGAPHPEQKLPFESTSREQRAHFNR